MQIPNSLRKIRREILGYITYIYLLASVVVVGLFVRNNFLYTEENDTAWAKLKDKKIVIEQKYSEIKANEARMLQDKADIENLSAEAERAKQLENRLRGEVNSDGVKLHIPSILIDLEQKSKKYKVDLKILYDSMVEKEGADIEMENDKRAPGWAGTKDKDKDRDNEDIEVESEQVGIQIERKEEKEEAIKSGTGDSVADVVKYIDVPSISGMSNILLPLEVHGRYDDVKGYIEYLDKIDYINPVYIDLKSSGKTLDGSIIINVVYKK